MGEGFLVARSPWLSYPAFLYTAGPPIHGWHHPQKDWNFPHQSSFKIMFYRLAHSPSWWNYFLSWGFLFSNKARSSAYLLGLTTCYLYVTLFSLISTLGISKLESQIPTGSNNCYNGNSVRLNKMPYVVEFFLMGPQERVRVQHRWFLVRAHLISFCKETRSQSFMTLLLIRENNLFFFEPHFHECFQSW